MADFLGMLGGGGLDPASIGWLYANGVNPVAAGLVPQGQDDALAAAKQAATAKLAAKMRQQSPDVPPPSNGDTFDQKWTGMLGPADVPLPQPRPADAPQAGAALPANSAPTMAIPAPMPAPATAAPAPPAPSLLSRINNGLANNSNLLLALGAGFAGAPSIGTGMQRAFSNAQPLAQQNQTVQALVARGMAPDMAILAAQNPAALNQILPRLMGAKQWTLGERTDPFGQKIPFLFDPVSGETRALNFSGGPATQGGATQQTQSASRPSLVRQGGHTYQLQPDGTYKAIQ